MGVALQGWKQIADYLGVSVRTTQLWEEERGLPVRRLPGGRSRVWADTEELEVWRRNADNSEVAPSVENGPDSPPSLDSPLNGTFAESPETTGWWRFKIAPFLKANRGVVITIVFVVVAGAIFLVSSPDGTRNQRSEGIPARWLVERRFLTVMDTAGKVIWKREFDYDLCIPGRETFWVEEPCLRDIDDDGEVETLFAEHRQAASRLTCYSQSGSEKWRFMPGRAVKTRGETFTSFDVRNFEVFRPTAHAALQVVVCSTNVPYYPCQIALLSNRGQVMSEYWHSGHIGMSQRQTCLTDFDSDGRLEILLAGVSNGFKQATLVVLPSEALSGASLEENPDYQLLGFEKPNEKARVLFSRSCLNRRSGEPFNWADAVELIRDSAMVGVTEERGSSVAVLYFLDRRFCLQRMDVVEQFKLRHEALLLAGQIDHPFDRHHCLPNPVVRYLSNIYR